MATRATGDIVKHQACDECRRRKLKSTKEPDGCFRCLDYSVPCVYSAQQPMGRPRTRHSGPQISITRSCNSSTPCNQETLQGVTVRTNIDSGSSSTRSLLRDALATSPSLMIDQPCEQGPIAFGAGGICLDFSNLNEVRAKVYHAPRTHLTSDQPCFCVERLCGALEVLTDVPDRFEDALRNARQTSKTLYEVLECPRCGLPPPELAEASQAPRFRMVIMAASMFPALVAAYHRVEKMADAEVVEAVKNRHQLTFELGKYGGLWGPLSKGSRRCEEYYHNKAVDTNTWRSTIRALLRADIYGFDLPSNGKDDEASYHHRGLWDFVQAMTAMSVSSRGNAEREKIGNCSIATLGGSSLALQSGLDNGLDDSADLAIAIGMAHRSLLKLSLPNQVDIVIKGYQVSIALGRTEFRAHTTT